MKKALLIVVLLSVTASIGACGGSGQSVTSQAKGKEMMNALFEQRWEDAKNLAHPEFADKVAADVEAFKVIYEKYEFREVYLSEFSRPWSMAYTGQQEADRQLDVNYQYRKKGADSWRSGVLHLRAKANDGLWGIGAVKLKFPSR